MGTPDQEPAHTDTRAITIRPVLCRDGFPMHTPVDMHTPVHAADGIDSQHAYIGSLALYFAVR